MADFLGYQTTTVRVRWSTADGNGAAVTATSVTLTARRKSDGTTSTSGITAGIDSGGTGSHITVVTFSSAASFYATGERIELDVEATVDGQTVRATLGEWAIGVAPANTTQWNGTNVATPATAGYPVVTLKVGTATGEVNASGGKVPATIAAGDIANNAITNASIADNAVSAAKVASNAFTAAKFASDFWTALRTALGLASANLDTQLGDIPTVTEFEARTLLSDDYFDPEADEVALKDDAITAAKYDQSSAFPLTTNNGSDLTEAGGTGDHLTAIPWNAAWESEVESAVADALAAAGLGPGTGARSVAVTVTASGNPLQNALVRATNGGETYTAITNSSGVANFSLDDDDWVFTVTKANYRQDGTIPYPLTVDGTEAISITMTYAPPEATGDAEEPNAMSFLTMHDAVCHLRQSLGGADGAELNENYRQAARFAVDDFFSGESGWQENKVIHRIALNAAYSTGTVAFDLTGGSSERLLTLSDGTFPDWTGRASIVIGTETYRVVSRLSDATAQLDETFCPSADVDSGTAYTLYQDAYLLPSDFTGNYKLNAASDWFERCWLDPDDFLELSTRWRTGSAWHYTILADERLPGRMSLRFFGYPSTTTNLTFLYERKRKAPILAGTEANSYVGTIAYTSGSNVITGTSTAFSDRMVGAILRIGDASDAPTPLAGDAPYLEEHVIASVASTTSLTLKTTVGLSTASGKKYRVSDPMSLDRLSHYALLKGVEAKYHELVNSSDDNIRSSAQAYERAKMKALEQQATRRGGDSLIGGPSSVRSYAVNVGDGT